MYLDAVNSKDEAAFDAGSASGGHQVFDPWRDWNPAVVSHHEEACCDVVKEWILATDQSLLNGGSELTGPRWLRHRYDWGPTRYPIHWCDIGRVKMLDCGVHAAIALEVFLARGVECYRVQLVQEYSEEAAAQWRLKWESHEAATTWLEGRMIYHEGCAVNTSKGGLKLWDPSASWWIDQDTTAGYGSLRALRIFAPVNARTFEWGGHVVPVNEWNVIEEAQQLKPMTSRPNRTSGAVRPLPARARLRSIG